MLHSYVPDAHPLRSWRLIFIRTDLMYFYWHLLMAPALYMTLLVSYEGVMMAIVMENRQILGRVARSLTSKEYMPSPAQFQSRTWNGVFWVRLNRRALELVRWVSESRPLRSCRQVEQRQ
jgi:hypothetical protein